MGNIAFCFVTTALTATAVGVMWFFMNWESQSIGVIWKQLGWTWWSIFCIIFCDHGISCCYYREWIFVISKYVLLSVGACWFFTVDTAIIQRVGATERFLKFSIWIISRNSVRGKHRRYWSITDFFSIFKLGLSFFLLQNFLFFVGVRFKWHHHHLMVFGCWFNWIFLFKERNLIDIKRRNWIFLNLSKV